MNLKDFFYYFYYKIFFFFYLKKNRFKKIDKDVLLFFKAFKINLYITYSIIIIDLTWELILCFIK